MPFVPLGGWKSDSDSSRAHGMGTRCVAALGWAVGMPRRTDEARRTWPWSLAQDYKKGLQVPQGLCGNPNVSAAMAESSRDRQVTQEDTPCHPAGQPGAGGFVMAAAEGQQRKLREILQMSH